MNASSPFVVTEFNLNSNVTLSVIDISEIDLELKAYIDEKLIQICEGCSTSNLSQVKKRIAQFMTSKNENIRMGATAEFFIHLYLSSQEFKQECLFFNLEENSIKKGFDGYYSKNDEEWIMESKSGSAKTKGISHSAKIKESYDDLRAKFEGVSKNNPWRNAYSHASQIDVGTLGNIRAHIKELADAYDENSYSDIKDMNIIPSSTIFLSGAWEDHSTGTEHKVANLLSSLEFNRMAAICITKRSLDLFLDYLGE